MWKNLLRLRQISQPLLKKSKYKTVAQLSNYKNYAQEAAAVAQADNKSTNKDTKSKDYVNPFARKQTEQTEEQPPVLSKEEEERRLKVLQLELDMANQEGRRVPSLEFMKSSHWEQVLTLPTKSARNKYYTYLWQIEKKQEAKARKKEERALVVAEIKEEQRKEREECDHIIYGLGHTSLFLRIYDSTINHWQNNRLRQAMQYAPKVVLDCGYDQHMTKREAQNAAKQLMLCFAENRMHDDPFDLHFCNVNLNSICMKSLKSFIPTMLNTEFPMNVHEKCFTEMFDKERLVYLTPHCRTDLKSFNEDDVYIIGAMVDTVSS